MVDGDRRAIGGRENLVGYEAGRGLAVEKRGRTWEGKRLEEERY